MRPRKRPLAPSAVTNSWLSTASTAARAMRPHNAHRDQRQGCNRHQHELPLHPAQRKPGRPHPLRREPVELNRQETDHQHRQPIMRHADPGDGDHRKQRIRPPSIEYRRQPAEQRPGCETDNGAGQGDLQRVGYRREKLAGDRPARPHLGAKIPTQHLTEPVEILDPDRPIQTVDCCDLRPHLRRCIGRRQQIRDVSRHHAHQQEHQHGHAEQYR